MIEMPNTMRTFLITTSEGERIAMSAIDATQVKRLFSQTFPRKCILTVHQYPDDALKVSSSF